MIDRDESVRLSYARDASGLDRIPDGVSRPRDEADVVELLREASADRMPITAAGGQTSTTGASISACGVLLSLRGLDRVEDVDREAGTVRVQAGVLLGDLKRSLAAQGFLFAPDPTSEEDVTVGGAIACNASGARSLRYGATRRHVAALRVALASGEVIEVRRSDVEKNTAGYALAQEPVDWFVGSEGTLGIILEAELKLLPLPPRVIGLGVPFASLEDALDFVVGARRSRHVDPRCLELFDAAALEIARDFQAKEGLAAWPRGAQALVYTEQVVDADGESSALEAWLALAEDHRASDADVLVFDSDAAIREARRTRHSVPSTMIERGNACRPAGGRRVSTDWAVPFRRLREALVESRRLAEEAGVGQPVTYGHAGSGHPHQNFIAHDAHELERMERVVEATLRHVIALGGTVSAEHGIGKLKRRWLPLQMSDVQIDVMRSVKHALDPRGLLAPGNIFPEGGGGRAP